MKYIATKIASQYRLVLFINIDRWTWLGFTIAKDGHNILCTVCILTLELGFEYVWAKFNEAKSTLRYSWNLPKI